MYLIDWKPETRTIEASLGGVVTAAEAEVFAAEIIALAGTSPAEQTTILIDRSRAHRIEGEAKAVLGSMRDALHLKAEVRIMELVGLQEHVVETTSERLQHVLDGRERYLVAEAS